MRFPRMYKISQKFDATCIEDIEGSVRREILSKIPALKKGARVAIATGSRGIANIDRIVKTTVDTLIELDCAPFIVPAMGSHGGATAEGQKATIEAYGITEKRMGVPIFSSMEVVELPQGDCVNKVYMDKYAYEADATIVVNRIKVHTDFHSTTESGLIKMCVIGLGKHEQALAIHRYGVYGLMELIRPTARQIFKHGNVILGVGVVENAYDETAIIKALLPEEFEREEMKLLDICRKTMPKLPVEKIDILVVDEIGKNVSGTGFDTNVIGRMRIRGIAEPTSPDIKAIVVTDLTEESHGNGIGVGLADFTTRRLVDKIDFGATYENTMTSTFVQRGHLPTVSETDQEAYVNALRICGPVEAENVRVMRIRNTLKIAELYVSESLMDEIRQNATIVVIGDAVDLFNESGSLNKF